MVVGELLGPSGSHFLHLGSGARTEPTSPGARVLRRVTGPAAQDTGLWWTLRLTHRGQAGASAALSFEGQLANIAVFEIDFYWRRVDFQCSVHSRRTVK